MAGVYHRTMSCLGLALRCRWVGSDDDQLCAWWLCVRAGAGLGRGGGGGGGGGGRGFGQGFRQRGRFRPGEGRLGYRAAGALQEGVGCNLVGVLTICVCVCVCVHVCACFKIALGIK